MTSLPATLPPSTAAPLRGGPALRWGVLAPGGIAGDFVSALHTTTDQRTVTVGSRSGERAEAFAGKHGIPRAYGSYEALVADPDVDIVYVASPHSQHRDLALLAIGAGKHVLVEKPIAMSADEAREIADAARAVGVFAMEAMWTRFLPQSTVIRQLLDDGVLGEVRAVTAELGVRMAFDAENRMWNPALGGGGLLDLGVYPLWFAHFVLGTPERVHAFGSLARTGVDEHASVLLEYPGGAQASATMTMTATLRNGAVISGSEARIEVEPLFITPRGFTLVVGDDRREWRDETDYAWWRDGLAWQAAAVARHIADGRTEAPEHPLGRSIAVLETIDEARAQVGYPPAGG